MQWYNCTIPVNSNPNPERKLCEHTVWLLVGVCFLFHCCTSSSIVELDDNEASSVWMTTFSRLHGLTANNNIWRSIEAVTRTNHHVVHVIQNYLWLLGTDVILLLRVFLYAMALVINLYVKITRRLSF
jgi:beta-lactamase regulating signal transducer with metallopeptidase domain